MVARTIENNIRGEMNAGKKAIILLGARQVGKTTLLRALFEKNDEFLWFNGDALNYRFLLTTQSVEQLRATCGTSSRQAGRYISPTTGCVTR